MAVTIKQVAEAAGVSRGTVDRVLHNRDGVRPEVAEHVRKIAAQLGYLPNRAGRMLAARKQPITLGFVLPDLGNAFYDDVVAGIRAAEQEMSDFGLYINITHLHGYDIQTHIDAIHEMVASGCTALCVATADTPELRKCIDDVVDCGTPVTTINTDLSGTKRLCYVGSDYVTAGRTAAGLLTYCIRPPIKLLVATGSLEVKGHNDRMYGFNEVLELKEVDFTILDIYETQDDDDIAYTQTIAHLKAHPDTNYLFAVAGGVPGICRAVGELEPRLGRPLHLICFDDTPPNREYLNSGMIDYLVCQEPFKQGYQSAMKLFHYFIDGGKGAMEDHITKAVIKITENLEEI